MFKTCSALVLASRSPRRRELLERLGINFTQMSADIDEIRKPDENPADFVIRMAREKAFSIVGSAGKSWILAADTIVVLESEILGKPDGPVAAERMLQRLSGRSHRVLTAFSLLSPDRRQVIDEISRARVDIAPLTMDLISTYVAQGEPLDKAGAYAIQGQGSFFVERVDGCPTTVIGLPMPVLIPHLIRCGVIAVDR